MENYLKNKVKFAVANLKSRKQKNNQRLKIKNQNCGTLCHLDWGASKFH